ncbi:hypothetical protein BDZ89DRAFT_1085905 [Hymenopellis radicata]|nr:hypothetical protein BDZ89DRAFT_1085905 [Hymenopellis radicata]
MSRSYGWILQNGFITAVSASIPSVNILVLFGRFLFIHSQFLFFLRSWTDSLHVLVYELKLVS